ncbi:MAG TPA: TonB-dependent receptor [Vicinamibacterales bacterium]|nr:TonB-dependent receptor [Vicinamibacterales bacterium]
MRLLTRLLFGLTCVVVIPASAYAQASITGVVTDSSGGVLPGVTVEASSPVLIEKSRTAVTDGSGQYRIVDLLPGTYAVVFTLTGFSTVRREGIELTGSFAASIDADLKVGSLEETITVTGESPVVDVQNTLRQTVLSKDLIQTLPATRAAGSLLNATPGLSVTDGAAQAATPTMTFFTAHGGRLNEGRMLINGMTVAGPFNGGGMSSLTYDTNNVEEISVVVSGALGESETGGPSMNIVPRSGGNTFGGQAFYNTAGKWSTGDNLDDDLRAVGIEKNQGLINAYDASGSFGGPIKRDRLWFYGSYRKYSTMAPGAGNVRLNAYAGDFSHWDYRAAETSVEPRSVQGRDIWSGRLTGQVTAKNRVTFSREQQQRCEGSTLTTAGEGCRQREADWVALGSNTLSPEAHLGYFDLPYSVTQATWSNPWTNRVLLEAGFSRYAYTTNGGTGTASPDGIFDQTPVTEQSAIDGHNANFSYRGVNGFRVQDVTLNAYRGSLSYVTGAHSVKVGYQGQYTTSDNIFHSNATQLAYRFQNRVPNQFTFRLPEWETADRTIPNAIFVQDTWTRNRLSVQGALRYDQASSYSPAEGNGTQVTSPFNAAPITFERTQGVNSYRDISPRVGAAYDVFGNGKTAVKFNLGRYLAPATNDTIYTANNPSTRTVDIASRSWSDTDKDFVVDCDMLNPAAQVVPGGDTCGAMTGDSLNFGKTGGSTRVNPDLLKGWGVRPVDWQWGINVAQELAPRVSLDVGYNRRWWGNYTVTDNTLVGPGDYEKWTIVAPKDARLPGGGGYPVDVYTLTQAAANRGADNYVTFETDFGPARTHFWHGVDITLNARTSRGLNLQAGTTTGRSTIDTCASVLNIDSPDARNCRLVDPYETTFRGSASYTVPKVDVLISSTLRSQPAQQRTGTTNPTNTGAAPSGATPSGANMNVPNLVVRDLLGRLPPGGLATGTTTVALLDETHRLYADTRRNQIDMRFAKVFRFSGRRLDVGVDLQNLLNTNYPTAYESQYSYTAPNGGTWNNPTAILGPRFMRLNFTLNY